MTTEAVDLEPGTQVDPTVQDCINLMRFHGIDVDGITRVVDGTLYKGAERFGYAIHWKIEELKKQIALWEALSEASYGTIYKVV